MKEWTCIVCGGSFDYVRKRENFARFNGFLYGVGFGFLVAVLLLQIFPR